MKITKERIDYRLAPVRWWEVVDWKMIGGWTAIAAFLTWFWYFVLRFALRFL